MRDTIYREDAIKALYKYSFVSKNVIEREINAIPTADRPQGEWIRTGRTNIYGGIEVQCSNCGDKVMVQHLEDEWYCRHCGADMGLKGANDEYERAVEQMEYDMLYEPTYNPEDGSM